MRFLLWLVLAAPAAWQLWAYRMGAMSYGEVLHLSGDLSIELLLVALAVTPLRMLAPRAPWSAWLFKKRRDIGVAVFGYAALHLGIYAIRKADFSMIVEEGGGADLLTGWCAFAMFTALAITSNNASMRWLKTRWKRLHKLTYPAAVLAVAHWILTAFDPAVAIAHAAVLGVLLAIRVAARLRQFKVT